MMLPSAPRTHHGNKLQPPHHPDHPIFDLLGAA